VHQILPIAYEDAAAISTLARDIWLRQYQEILSRDQIHYMLKQRYTPKVIQAQLDDGEIWWRKLVLDERIIGFSCCMRTLQPDELKIDKLYIHHDHHRKGYGRIFIDDAVNILREITCSRLILTVNKHNQSAIHAYRRYGFSIVEDSVVDIGGGFFMNDYLMAMMP